MSDRRPPLPPRVAPAIPVVPWTSAPPPIPPRSFSTEPPPTQDRPSEPTLVRQGPIDARALMMGDPRQAEEIRDEARALVRSAVEEALAPLHVRMNELERRLEAAERRPVAATRPTPAVGPRALAVAPPVPMNAPPPLPAPPPLGVAPPPLVMGPLASPAPPPVILAPSPLPSRDSYGGIVTASPRAMQVSYDIDVPFDGARRRRRILILFGIAFVLLVGALLGSMAMSYSR